MASTTNSRLSPIAKMDFFQFVYIFGKKIVNINMEKNVKKSPIFFNYLPEVKV